MSDAILSSEDTDKLFKELVKIGVVLEPGSQELTNSEQTPVALFEILDWIRTVCKYNKMDVESCRREMKILRNHIDTGGPKG